MLVDAKGGINLGIQRCKECGRKFNYRDVLESVGWGYKPLSCSHCGAKHNLKMWYIFMLAAILSLPMFFINQISQFPLTIFLKTLIVLFYIVYISIILGLSPFIIRYSLKGELDKNYNIYTE